MGRAHSGGREVWSSAPSFDFGPRGPQRSFCYLRERSVRRGVKPREGGGNPPAEACPLPPIPDDDALDAMEYDDLVGLADRCGISGGCLDDEKSARAALRARRGERRERSASIERIASSR
eukprot:gene511-biopygen3457